jgi:hypothetical protein
MSTSSPPASRRTWLLQVPLHTDRHVNGTSLPADGVQQCIRMQLKTPSTMSAKIPHSPNEFFDCPFLPQSDEELDFEEAADTTTDHDEEESDEEPDLYDRDDSDWEEVDCDSD